MYKLFLCLRYLRRRYLALIAAASVALCVAMVLIVVSVMDGFLRKVEGAAKGLFGDVVLEGGLSGIGRYDEFIAQLKRDVPEVQAATPTIWSYGILRVGDTFTDTVGICGIRLPERLSVTDFGDGLFVQAGRADASFNPPLERLIQATDEHIDLIDNIYNRQMALPPGQRDNNLLERLAVARINAPPMRYILENALLKHKLGQADDLKAVRKQLAEVQGALADEEAKPTESRNRRRIEKLTDEVARLSRQLDRMIRPPADRVILGLGISGLSFRTPEGETVRLVTPGRNVQLSLLPVGRGLSSTITPNTRTFTIIDDAKTDVYTIDSKTVYVPFDTLQALADMGRRTDQNGQIDPARCSQIQIKVRPEFASERELVKVRRKVQAAWSLFTRQHPDAQQSQVAVQTWRERLDKFIGPIEKQRTLVTMMFGIISFVAVLLIFAIFYMIVMQKVRDLGVIRAVGGSSAGVAQIFLAFGAATGLVGSVAGLVVGWLFVHYINEIQDALAAWFGFRVWDRDVFMFDRIPSQVDVSVAAVIALWAVASGLIGALIPSVRAAVMEPVEAIRYE